MNYQKNRLFDKDLLKEQDRVTGTLWPHLEEL